MGKRLETWAKDTSSQMRGGGFFLRLLLRGAGSGLGWSGRPLGSSERLFSSSRATTSTDRGSDGSDGRRGPADKRRIRAARRSEREELRRWRGADSWDAARDDGGSRGMGHGGARRRRTVDWYEAVLHDDDDASAAPGRRWTRVKYKHRSTGGNPAKTRRERGRRDGMHERRDPPRGTRAQLRAVLDDIFEEHARGFRDESPFASRINGGSTKTFARRRAARAGRVADDDDDFDWNAFEELVFDRGARRTTRGGFGRERAAFDDFFGSDSEFDDFFGGFGYGSGYDSRRQSATVSRADCEDCVALGIPPGVELDEASLRGYLREKAKVWHPDRHPGVAKKAGAEREFKRCYSAFDALMARVV